MKYKYKLFLFCMWQTWRRARERNLCFLNTCHIPGSVWVVTQMLIFTLVLCELNLPASSFAQRLNNLSQVAQLKSSGARIQTQSVWPYSPSCSTSLPQKFQVMKYLCIGPSPLGLYRELFRGQRWWFWTLNLYFLSHTKPLSCVKSLCSSRALTWVRCLEDAVASRKSASLQWMGFPGWQVCHSLQGRDTSGPVHSLFLM